MERFTFAALVALATLAATGCSDGPDDADPVDTAPEVAAEPHDGRLDEALQRISAGDHAGGRELAERVLGERPGSARAEFVLALSFHKQKNYGRALPHFERALAIGPTFEPFATVHYFHGWCLYNLGELPRARAAFETHLGELPDEGDSHFALGLIALDEGRLDDATTRLERAIALNTERLQAGDASRRADVAKARARLAEVYLQRDELEAARNELEACVTIYPAHYTAWYKLHRVLAQLGEHELAEQALVEHDRWLARVRPGAPGLGGGR